MDVATLTWLLVAATPVPVVRVSTTATVGHQTAGFISINGPTEVTSLGGAVDVTTGVQLGSFTVTVRESLGAAPPGFEPGGGVRSHVTDALALLEWQTKPHDAITVTLAGGALLPLSTVSRELASPGGLALQGRIEGAFGPVLLWASLDAADHPLGTDGDPPRGPGDAGPRVPIPPSIPRSAAAGMACDPLVSDTVFRYACRPDPRGSVGSSLGAGVEVLDGVVRVEGAATLTTNWAVPVAFALGAPYADQFGTTTPVGRATLRVRPFSHRQLVELNAGVWIIGSSDAFPVGAAALVIGL